MRRLVIAVLVLAAAGLGYYLYSRPAAPETPVADTPQPPPSATAPAPAPAPAAAAATSSPPVPAAEPAPTETPAQLLSRGEDLLKSGRKDDGVAALQKALDADPSGKTGRRAAKALSDHFAALKQERKALGYLLRTDLSGEARAQAETKAAAMAAAALSPTPTGDDLVVTVQPGDSLGGIARRHGTTDDCIARVNQLKDKHRIVAGQRLKVLTGVFRILVEKEARRLTLLLDGVPVKTYRIGIGANGKTPTTTFTIEEKIPEPPWHRIGQPALPFGHPENPLGTRWLGFRETPQYAGFGIHGTSQDGSIGEATSNGCVRMHNGDVEELFDLVPRGTLVEIRD